MEMSDMDPEGNVDIPGVDMEGQEAPKQVVEIDDSNTSQDPSLIAPEVPADPDGPTKISTPATEGSHISTRFISQPDTYTPSMTGKRYGYAMKQLDIHGVLYPDTHMLFQEYFTNLNTKL